MGHIVSLKHPPSSQVERYRSPLEAHMILLNPRGDVLLTCKKTSSYSHERWCLPSGKVEAYESPRQALIREMEGKLSISIDPEYSSTISIKQPHFAEPNQIWQSLAFFFYQEDWEGEILNNTFKNTSKVEFFPLSDLPLEMMPISIKGLENFVQRIPFSEFHI